MFFPAAARASRAPRQPPTGLSAPFDTAAVPPAAPRAASIFRLSRRLAELSNPPRRFAGLAYERSAHKLADLPPEGTPEVAFAGRSNAGKSSAINTLAQHTRLAFVSKTPGRTQMINFFRLRDGGRLADLPGYGYAKVPASLKAHWEHVLSTYLARRKSLCGLVLIMDARHPLTALDRTMLEWFRPTGRPVHALLTKSDKLSRSEAATTLRTVRAELATYTPLFSAQLFSSLKKTGIEEAEATIGPWLDAALAESGESATIPDAEENSPEPKGRSSGPEMP